MDKKKRKTEKERKIIAVTGKGGAGKTTLVAILAKILSSEGVKVLAVDADPPISLTYALGAKPLRTISDFRDRLIKDPKEKRKFSEEHTGKVMKDEVLMEVNNMGLLIMGRAEGAGCFCGINELLKYGIESLAKHYEVTLIDCEAGVEQINRRVIERITTLITVSDPTVKGLQTAVHVNRIADDYGVKNDFETWLVINKTANGAAADLENKALDMNLNVLGSIPLDENVTGYDRVGRPTIELPDNSPSVIAVGEMLKDIMK